MRIKVGDVVEVLAGDDAGARGKVLRLQHGKGKVIVEGVNQVRKHVRRSQKNPRGGQLSKEMPINVSNVLLVCPACGAAARMGARYLDDGSKQRYCKKCGTGTGEIAPRRPAYAKK